MLGVNVLEHCVSRERSRMLNAQCFEDFVELGAAR
jgi:hypothetical protein